MRKIYDSAGLYNAYMTMFQKIPPALPVVPYLGAHTKALTVDNVRRGCLCPPSLFLLRVVCPRVPVVRCGVELMSRGVVPCERCQDQQSDTVDGKINFKKLRSMYGILLPLLQRQRIPYSHKPVRESVVVG